MFLGVWISHINLELYICLIINNRNMRESTNIFLINIKLEMLTTLIIFRYFSRAKLLANTEFQI